MENTKLKRQYSLKKSLQKKLDQNSNQTKPFSIEKSNQYSSQNI